MADLIDRQAAIDGVFATMPRTTVGAVLKVLWALPSAQPERLDADQIYNELLKVYGMDGLPCEVYNIIGMLMIRLRMEVEHEQS